MKKLLLSVILLLVVVFSFAQSWTSEQLNAANTAKDVKELSNDEKEVIKYINLCRLYPSDFAAIEVKNYNGVPGISDPSLKKYKASLIKELAVLLPIESLKFHELLYNDAKCFSNELFKSGKAGHERKICTGRKYAECLSFGNPTPKDIALAWLIDSGIPSLGHRKNCLNPKYNKTGISIAPHKEYSNCAVAEFWF